MTLKEAFDLYRLDYISFRNQSAKTEEMHNICARALVKFVGDIPVEELTFDMVRNWKLNMEKRMGLASVRGYIIKLRVVLAYLEKRGLKVLSPDVIPVPKRGDKVPSFIGPDDVTKLIDCSVRLRSKAIIALLYASGIRISELINLDRSDIKENTFTVVGKGNKARLCFLDDRAKCYIDLYLSSREDNHPALFVSTQQLCRMSATNIQFVFKAARTKANLTERVTPHTLRHSFATNLLRNNCNLRYVQVLLGHASIQTTQMYTHVVDEDLRKIYSSYHTV